MGTAKTSFLDQLSFPEKRAVAWHSVLAATFLAILKLAVGWWSNSLGILSEAANSGLDVVAAALIYWSVLISDKPADADHQYGHQKIENFSAFLQTGLVLATGLWGRREVSRLLGNRSQFRLPGWQPLSATLAFAPHSCQNGAGALCSGAATEP